MKQIEYEILIDKKQSFTFETVLSTDRNLKLFQRTKDNGYFIRCIYVLTADPKINVNRVKVCDICHIYDNSDVPFRIFKKRKDVYFYWETASGIRSKSLI